MIKCSECLIEKERRCFSKSQVSKTRVCKECVKTKLDLKVKERYDKFKVEFEEKKKKSYKLYSYVRDEKEQEQVITVCHPREWLKRQTENRKIWKKYRKIDPYRRDSFSNYMDYMYTQFPRGLDRVMYESGVRGFLFDEVEEYIRLTIGNYSHPNISENQKFLKENYGCSDFLPHKRDPDTNLMTFFSMDYEDKRICLNLSRFRDDIEYLMKNIVGITDIPEICVRCGSNCLGCLMVRCNKCRKDCCGYCLYDIIEENNGVQVCPACGVSCGSELSDKELNVKLEKLGAQASKCGCRLLTLQ